MMTKLGAEIFHAAKIPSHSQNTRSLLRNANEKEDQLNMLSWCYKYGMQMMLGDDRMGPSMANRSYVQLEGLLAEYKNVPGVAGYWLIDEPTSAVGFQ